MTKGELKKIIKETVKDCIKEVLLENEVFSSLIKEVMHSTKSIVLETAGTKSGDIIYKSRYNNIGNELINRNKDDYEIKEEKIVEETRKPIATLSEDKPMISGFEGSGEATEYMESIAEQNNIVPLNTIMALVGMKR